MEELYFHTCEADGEEGAKRKAWLLNRESRYNIISIEHRARPSFGLSSARSPMLWGRSQFGYKITAVSPLPEYFSTYIPGIVEV